MVDPVCAFKAIFHVGLLSLAIAPCDDTRGKEFVLGFMENNRRWSIGTPKQIYVTTSKAGNVNVEITSPNWYDPYLSEQFIVMAGEVKTIMIGSNLTMTGTELSTKGILVIASDEVTVYGANVEFFSTDAFLGLSTDLIGTEYFAVTHFPSEYYTEFLIAGTKDSTKVNVRLTSNTDAKDVFYNGATYKPGDTITLVMNRYDTFQVQSDGDLTGSYITSDKPISFFSGNMLTSVGNKTALSMLMEQIIPVDKWGHRFATMPTPFTESGDYFRIIASCSLTSFSYTCNQNGNTQTTSLTLKNAGDFSHIYIGTGTFCYWESDDPVILIQFSSSDYSSNMIIDPTMMMIPPIEQYSADYTFTTPTTHVNGSFQSFFIFIANTQDLQGLKIDDTNIPMTYNAVPKTSLSIGYFEVTPGLHTVRHTSSIPVFGGFLYGRSLKQSESYGFPLGLWLPDAYVRGVCSSIHPCKKNFGFFKQVRQNINIKSGVIREEREVKSLTTCAALCVRNCKCTSYSYHEEKKICRSHSRYTCTSLDQNDNTAEEGWIFWTIE